MPSRQKLTKELKNIVTTDNALESALETSIKNANEPGIETLEQFYDFIDGLLTHIPTEEELMPSVRRFYFLLEKSPGGLLKTHPRFNEWMNAFVQTRGDFLNTTESVECLDTFINDPAYNVDDYVKPLGGWLTYNQFLARYIKPGKRPIAGLCNDSVIVSPADFEFRGEWLIEPGSTVTAKGVAYPVTGLLENSAFKNEFSNGIFTHGFLSITDYHRYHAPVAGIVREIKHIPATTWVQEEKKPGGDIENTDDVGFQFQHTRGYVIMESAVGLVAVIAVGMGHISSVIFTAEEGAALMKGEELGYFAFGGSDIILLFQANKIKITAQKNQRYKQGEQIAEAINSGQAKP